MFLLQRRRRRGGDAGGPDFVCCKLREKKRVGKITAKDHRRVVRQGNRSPVRRVFDWLRKEQSKLRSKIVLTHILLLIGN